MTWSSKADLILTLEDLPDTIHAGAPRSPSDYFCLARLDDVADLVWTEIERLRSEIADLHEHAVTWRGSSCPCDDPVCPIEGRHRG